MKTTTYMMFILLLTGMVSCKKVEYRKIDKPAYVRVFNNLTYTIGVSNKDEPQPFLCMLIDPELDSDGKPTGAAIIGDFLDKRSAYASPNPAHAGLSTSRFNPEYPGKELVLTAPVLNGFDLTNWAQIPSGKHRIMFMSRPINDIPFFQLEKDLRNNIMIDTVLNLTEREVYTLHVLQQNFATKKNMLYVREETFHKQPLSESFSYVNFYNLSADGFFTADEGLKNLRSDERSVPMRFGIQDNMNVYLTQIDGTNKRIPELSYQFAGNMKRNLKDTKVSPYYAFPILPEANDNGVATDSWQFLQFLAPGMDPTSSVLFGAPPSTFTTVYAGNLNGLYAYAQFDTRRYPHLSADILPNMIINVHSGADRPRSFGVVNTIEVVNGKIYLSTVQRKYAAPTY